ncbi:hypothetical protein J1605_004518 [Eschrichtius robustus]|uniref:Uncharacterized protein n=1 Tax=Eschrichtius robustus TaxID=9764 RepID=A0AB34HID3_ESCRO|nr:hypothetical protein J1605_004518 [Eschrichtius robustus]
MLLTHVRSPFPAEMCHIRSLFSPSLNWCFLTPRISGLPSLPVFMFEAQPGPLFTKDLSRGAEKASLAGHSQSVGCDPKGCVCNNGNEFVGEIVPEPLKPSASGCLRQEVGPAEGSPWTALLPDHLLLGPAAKSQNSHPYIVDRHYSREQHYTDHGSNHHYRGSRDDFFYEERNHDGWSHDYDNRRDSGSDGKWHSSRH